MMVNSELWNRHKAVFRTSTKHFSFSSNIRLWDLPYTLFALASSFIYSIVLNHLHTEKRLSHSECFFREPNSNRICANIAFIELTMEKCRLVLV